MKERIIRQVRRLQAVERKLLRRDSVRYTALFRHMGLKENFRYERPEALKWAYAIKWAEPFDLAFTETTAVVTQGKTTVEVPLTVLAQSAWDLAKETRAVYYYSVAEQVKKHHEAMLQGQEDTVARQLKKLRELEKQVTVEAKVAAQNAEALKTSRELRAASIARADAHAQAYLARKYRPEAATEETLALETAPAAEGTEAEVLTKARRAAKGKLVTPKQDSTPAAQAPEKKQEA